MDMPGFLDLPGAFERHFRVVPADTADLRDICFRIRHSVYCEEFAFEPVRPDGRETDQWDATSLHCLLQNVVTSEYVGCVRLVVPPYLAPDTPLPFERICTNAIDRTIVDPGSLSRDSIGEVSRLALIPDYRRHRREGASKSRHREHSVIKASVSEIPYVQTGLYLGILALAHLHGIESLFMLLEPRLARQLGMLSGLRPQIIGSAVEHRGERVPALLSVSDAISNPNLFIRPLFDRIWSGIAYSFDHVRAAPPAVALEKPIEGLRMPRMRRRLSEEKSTEQKFERVQRQML